MAPVFGSGNWSDMFAPEYGYVVLTGTASGETNEKMEGNIVKSLPIVFRFFSSSLHADLEVHPGREGAQEVRRQVPQDVQRGERRRQRLQLRPGSILNSVNHAS